jgi:2-polyprenyl-3-methyl-5-hydroxy-6-metoxy-1,4-benzoquinol methylase
MNNKYLSIENYGWNDTHIPKSHSCLLPAIESSLCKCGAKKVLDLGCGNGSLSHTLHSRGFIIAGCDTDRRGVELANSRGIVKFFVASVYDDAKSVLDDNQFDAVVSAEVIEHLYQPRYLAKFAYDALKPGGTLVVTTPYHGYLKNLALSLTNKWDRHHHPLRDGGHIKFWSKHTLTEMLTTEGFSVVSFQGIGRLPYLWKSMVMTATKQ